MKYDNQNHSHNITKFIIDAFFYFAKKIIVYKTKYMKKHKHLYLDIDSIIVQEDISGNIVIRLKENDKIYNCIEFIHSGLFALLTESDKDMLFITMITLFPTKLSYAVKNSRYQNCYNVFLEGVMVIENTHASEILKHREILNSLSDIDYQTIAGDIVNLTKTTKKTNLRLLE